MIRIPAHRNTVNPPGQIVNHVTLADYIKEVEQQEGKMISEVDLRDWIYVNTPSAYEALESMDDLARMNNVEPIGPYNVLYHFIKEVEKIKNKQIRRILPLENRT